MSLTAPVAAPPDEFFLPGDRVHRLRTDRVYIVIEVGGEAITLRNASGHLQTVARGDFDAVCVYGGVGVRVYGKVNAATIGHERRHVDVKI